MNKRIAARMERVKKEVSDMRRKADELELCDLRGKIPPDGKDHSDAGDYRWYRIKNREDAKFIEEYYALPPENNLDDITDLPAVVCIEWLDDAYIFTLTDCATYVRNFFSLFDIDVKLDTRRCKYADI